ncbi:hypothetical protein [Paenibacillus lycopersici]|uniref:hypothetical protein n=1 Tax=Paenibacillus lycopersici TaxID=2704462 RepID=UPI001CDBCACC|nr:hypothetical protein [Paenibacillus lycopersici]
MDDNELLQLLEKAIIGDESAFQLVYQATHRDVYRTVAFLVFNKQDIEDERIARRASQGGRYVALPA